MRDVYVISKEVFRALEERGRTQKNINELINIYKTSDSLAFQDHNDHEYIVIRMDTNNTRYHHIITNEEYLWYKSMGNTRDE